MRTRVLWFDLRSVYIATSAVLLTYGYAWPDPCNAREKIDAMCQISSSTFTSLGGTVKDGGLNFVVFMQDRYFLIRSCNVTGCARTFEWSEPHFLRDVHPDLDRKEIVQSCFTVYTAGTPTTAILTDKKHYVDLTAAPQSAPLLQEVGQVLPALQSFYPIRTAFARSFNDTLIGTYEALTVDVQNTQSLFELINAKNQWRTWRVLPSVSNDSPSRTTSIFVQTSSTSNELSTLFDNLDETELNSIQSIFNFRPRAGGPTKTYVLYENNDGDGYIANAAVQAINRRNIRYMVSNKQPRNEHTIFESLLCNDRCPPPTPSPSLTTTNFDVQRRFTSNVATRPDICSTDAVASTIDAITNIPSSKNSDEFLVFQAQYVYRLTKSRSTQLTIPAAHLPACISNFFPNFPPRATVAAAFSPTGSESVYLLFITAEGVPQYARYRFTRAAHSNADSSSPRAEIRAVDGVIAPLSTMSPYLGVFDFNVPAIVSAFTRRVGTKQFLYVLGNELMSGLTARRVEITKMGDVDTFAMYGDVRSVVGVGQDKNFTTTTGIDPVKWPIDTRAAVQMDGSNVLLFYGEGRRVYKYRDDGSDWPDENFELMDDRQADSDRSDEANVFKLFCAT